MRLVAVHTADGPRVAERRGDRLLDLGPGDVGTLVHNGLPADGSGAELDPAAPVRPLLLPGKIVAVGLNYGGHVKETGRQTPTSPVLFAKWPSTIQSNGAPIEFDPSLTTEVDWEGELAVLVGAPLRDASCDEALDAVFGYTVANDVSARDVQRSDVQWTRGKSFDTFCPIGPEVVTADEIADPQRLRLVTRVNGTVVQDASTSDMIFGVAEILSFCSRSFPLYPGDLVLTGTPWGCGGFMDPKQFLADGDVVEVEIEGIGILRNPVVERVSPTAGPVQAVA